jgi:hypothetical protein
MVIRVEADHISVAAEQNKTQPIVNITFCTNLLHVLFVTEDQLVSDSNSLTDIQVDAYIYFRT